MRDILRDRQHEGVCVIAIEEPYGDLRLAAELSDPEPMHTVDDAHSWPVHDDRRQRVLCPRERLYVLRILPRKTWGISTAETF
jgi:hypothetical protein